MILIRSTHAQLGANSSNRHRPAATILEWSFSMIKLVHCDVLTAGHRANALILAIDGTKHWMEDHIARAYARRWPDLWRDLDGSIERDHCYG